MKRVLLSVLLLAGLLMISGCGGVKGLPFEEITKIPENSGVVYIYMPRKNFLSKMRVSVDNDNGIGIPLEQLSRGRYTAYVAPKGENLFRYSKKQFVTLNVQPNESYFIRLTSKRVDYILFTRVYTYLDIIDPTVGFVEIAKTTSLTNFGE